MPTSLDDPCERLWRVTKPQLAAFKKLGLHSARDLLLHFPRRYLDFTKTARLSGIKPGEPVTVRVTLKSIRGGFGFKTRRPLAEAVVSDDSASLKVVWFNQPYLAKSLRAGEELFLSGSADRYGRGLQLTNPTYERVSDFPVHTARLVPVYPVAEGLYQKSLRALIKTLLPLAAKLEDTLPHAVRKSEGLPALGDAVRALHFPDSLTQVELARRRMAFEEIFVSQLASESFRLALERSHDYVVPFDQPLIKSFVSSLPFALTAAQRRAAWDILKDLERPRPMNRLVLGDVGSGKTLVALIAALEVAARGYQVALLAPTDILAAQHYQSAERFLDRFFKDRKLNLCLLTQHRQAANGGEATGDGIRQRLKAGDPGLYVGTHALLSEQTEAPALALVVVDEQHRFGVKQRSSLPERAGKRPHLLSLSATPIPRTLQLAFFGELDVSRIAEKPEGRKPVATELVRSEAERTAMYRRLEGELGAGRQAFVVTPLISESDLLGARAATAERRRLAEVFPTRRVGLLHGQQKPNVKEAAMREFLEGKTDVLVATAVVEVGVDVPNASVMVVEGAERFGLAQLHQLRGRIGRGEHKGTCFVCPTEGSEDGALERLERFSTIQDGFELSELDLALRGSGDVFGLTQSGWNFKYFSPKYFGLVPKAKRLAQGLLRDDPELKNHQKLALLVNERDVRLD